MSDTTKAASFCLTAPEARSVFLAGTFNDWSPTAAPMQRDPDGRWTLSLDLAAGTYEYKFVVDGQWCCEPGCAETTEGARSCVPNAHGTMNSTITVEAP